MTEFHDSDTFFEELAQRARLEQPEQAPSTLKSRIYSAFFRHQQQSGPLKSLAETEAGLCVFENIVAMSPVGDAAKCLNPCSVCHARVLAEHIANAPIYWRHCPYVEFQKDFNKPNKF